MNFWNIMNYNKASTNELNKVFQDRFKKWPRLFKWSVFFCFFFPLFFYLVINNNEIGKEFHSSVFAFFLVINLLILFWGIKLHLFSKRYWHKKYYIYITCSFALIPLYVLIYQYTQYCL